MLASFIILVVGLFFVIGAVRILVGWLAPSGAAATFDRSLDTVGKGSAKFLVVMVGLVIIAAVIFGLAGG